MILLLDLLTPPLDQLILPLDLLAPPLDRADWIPLCSGPSCSSFFSLHPTVWSLPVQSILAIIKPLSTQSPGSRSPWLAHFSRQHSMYQTSCSLLGQTAAHVLRVRAGCAQGDDVSSLKDDFEVVISSPLPSKSWDCRCEPLA